MPQPTLLNNEIRDMLMDCGLFDPLLPEDFHVAAGYFNISNIAQGEVIFLEGDAGTFMCILHSGQVAVQKTNHEGQRVTIATLRSGRAFGEMAVLDGERRSASCLAASDSVLLNLGKDSLENAQRSPQGGGQDHPRDCHRLVQAPAHGRRAITVSTVLTAGGLGFAVVLQQAGHRLIFWRCR